jgi:hypothetical protein
VILVTVALAALAVGLPVYLGGFLLWSIPCAIAFLAAGWLGSGLGPGLPPLRRIAAATVASLVAFGLLATKVLPPLDPVWPSRAIASAFEANRPCPDSTLVSVGYEEPSLVFLTATSTLLTNASTAAARLQADGCAVAAIEKSNQRAFDATFAKSATKPHAFATIEGINYSNGKQVSVALYRMSAR